MTFPTRWGPLRHTNFRWFFFGETINTAGSSMSGLALAFAVLHIDNSPTALGVVVAAALDETDAAFAVMARFFIASLGAEK